MSREEPAIDAFGPSEISPDQRPSRWRSVIAHPWMIGIFGGAIAIILGTYAVAAIWGEEKPHIPPGLLSPRRELSLFLNPEVGCQKKVTTISISIKGATANNNVSIEVNGPSGGAISYVEADEEGSVSFQT